MLEELIAFIAQIWRADSKMRDSSMIGESDLDKRSRSCVAWICAGLIILLTATGVLWWWLTGY